MDELYKKYRPQKLTDVVGQDHAIAMLKAKGRTGGIPHFILFTGDSGTGKTTLARMLAKKLKATGLDLSELNAASKRGIEMVRNIEKQMYTAPIGGGCRIWIIDECHRLTADAQEAFLKPLEDTPKHVHFFLCTTHPKKLKEAIRTRAYEIDLKRVGYKDMQKVIGRVTEAEGFTISEDVEDAIIKAAEGSPRKALVILDQVYQLSDETQQLAAISSTGNAESAHILGTMLIYKREKWPKIAAFIKELDEDGEGLRHMVLAMATNAMLKGGKVAPHAAWVADCFRLPYYDTGSKPGLVMSAYEACHPPK